MRKTKKKLIGYIPTLSITYHGKIYEVGAI